MHRVIRLLACLIFAATVTPAGAESLSHGRFHDVQIYKPPGTVKQVALFLSGDAGWDKGMASMASQLAADGTLVAGIDVQKFFAALEKDDDTCVYPDGDLENLSHFVQAYYKLPTYFTPLLIGYSSGATLAYATLAQAPHGLFGGAMSLSFCADLDLDKPLCKAGSLDYIARKEGGGVRVLPRPTRRAPWFVVQGAEDEVCPASQARDFASQARAAHYVEMVGVGHDYRAPQWMSRFKSTYVAMVASGPPALPPPPTGLADLPVIEVPASGNGDLFAIFLSGDGGWAGLDKQVAAALAERGIPVAGIDSLRYFWKERTPASLAADIDRIVRYYASQWKKKRVVLIGYSQGADVLPFAINRLPRAARERVQLNVLIGVSATAAFEFHISNWFGGSAGMPVKPETDKLSSADTLCLYGEDDDDSLCPTIGADHAKAINLSGGHHFGGDYHTLAELILRHAAPPPEAAAR